MTDGPFRNAELSSRWKRYGDELVSDAASPEERAEQACHSMLGDVDMAAFGMLYKELIQEASCSQMSLDPAAAVEATFDRHPMSPFLDLLQRHLIANVLEYGRPDEALDHALTSSTVEWSGSAKNRIDEECIRAREIGDMNHEEYQKGLQRNRETFAAIDFAKLHSALATGNKRAFSPALRKKIGVDEGPEE